MMERRKFVLLLLLTMVGLLPSLSQTKVANRGNMQITVPSTWQVNDEANGMMASIMAYDNAEGRMYMLMELSMKSSPEYLMEYSMKNIDFVRAADFTEDGVKTKFHSYDACRSVFTTQLMGRQMQGVAYTFNDGESKSYGIIAIYKIGCRLEPDPILNSFKLVKSDKPQMTFKDAREEMQFFIDGLEGNWGASIGNGMVLDMMAVHPTRNELTYTLRFSAISINDIGRTNLPAIKKDLEASVPSILDNYSANVPAVKRCMDEDYTIVFRILDMNKEEICTITCEPKDYK